MKNGADFSDLDAFQQQLKDSYIKKIAAQVINMFNGAWKNEGNVRCTAVSSFKQGRMYDPEHAKLNETDVIRHIIDNVEFEVVSDGDKYNIKYTMKNGIPMDEFTEKVFLEMIGNTAKMTKMYNVDGGQNAV